MTTKNNGVYYTPAALSDYMVQHSFRSLPEGEKLSILEPSCGDGVFIDAICKNLNETQKKLYSLECVEIDQKTLATAKGKSCKKFKKKEFFHRDFLDFQAKKRKRYDLIIGNPPYVVRKRLPDETVEKCKTLYQSVNLGDQYFRNLWGAFLVSAIKLLSEKGVLAYVLPAELLQVKFTEELRNRLLESFERVEIISFNNIIFDDIEQDTIVLFCYKKHSEKGLFFGEKKDIADLVKSPVFFQGKNLQKIKNVKWTSHVLTEEELNLLSTLKKNFSPVSDYCTAVAGIVTAANHYFIVDDKTVEDYDLEEFTIPIIQRGLYINGSAVFSTDALEHLRESGKACNLLDFNGRKEDSFSKKVREYLDLGIEQEIHERYKCKKRSPWYSVPGIWKSDGIFFKRSHLYPKMLANEADSMVTDSAYRIKMMEGRCVKSLVYSFYNSLSLSLAELEGRYYGGGVLELTPNEFKSIVIPYTPINEKDFNVFTEMFEHKKSIDDITFRFDEEILMNRLGIDRSSIKKLQTIKEKLTLRRLNKAQKRA